MGKVASALSPEEWAVHLNTDPDKHRDWFEHNVALGNDEMETGVTMMENGNV